MLVQRHATAVALRAMANNRYLATEVSLLRARIDGISPTSPARSKARHAVAIAEHREMLDALRRHDADRAESVAREHFRRAMARRLGEVAAAKGPGRVPST